MANVYINGHDGNRWGIVLDETSASALMTPPPNKEYIKNKSRLEHGSRIDTNNPKMDEREVSIILAIYATSKTQFFQRYKSFCDEVLLTGIVDIADAEFPDVVYHCVYLNCTQCSYYNGSLGKFTLRLIESNPNNRT